MLKKIIKSAPVKTISNGEGKRISITESESKEPIKRVIQISDKPVDGQKKVTPR